MLPNEALLISARLSAVNSRSAAAAASFVSVTEAVANAATVTGGGSALAHWRIGFPAMFCIMAELSRRSSKKHASQSCCSTMTARFSLGPSTADRRVCDQ